MKILGGDIVENFAWAFANNRYGELGYGESGYGDTSNIPVKVLNIDNIIAVFGGHIHSLALDKNGNVWVWCFPFTSKILD